MNLKPEIEWDKTSNDAIAFNENIIPKKYLKPKLKKSEKLTCYQYKISI